MGSSLFGGGSSTTVSNPKDMTPPAFQALQGPLASALMYLTGTGGPVYGGAGSAGGAFSFPGMNTAFPPTPFVAPGTGSDMGRGGGGNGVGANQGTINFGQTGFQGNGQNGSGGFSVGGVGGNPDAGGSTMGATPFSMAATMPTGAPNPTASPATGAANFSNSVGSAAFPGGSSPFSLGGYSQFFSPTGNNGTTGAGAGTFTAGLSPAESQMLGNIYGIGSAPSAASNAAGSFLSSVLNPNYPSTLATSPQTQAAVQAATNPLITAFQQSTMPALQGQFAAGGQVLNGPGFGPGGSQVGGGSSPFAHAAALAETGLGQNIASTASNIENQAYQTGLQQQTEAATQAPALQQSEVQNLVSTLQAEALPRLIDQYGLDQGLSEFNNRVNVMLQALGLAAGKAGPDIANSSSGSSSFSPGIIPSVLGGLGGGTGIAKLAAL